MDVTSIKIKSRFGTLIEYTLIDRDKAPKYITAESLINNKIKIEDRDRFYSYCDSDKASVPNGWYQSEYWMLKNRNNKNLLLVLDFQKKPNWEIYCNLSNILI